MANKSITIFIDCYLDQRPLLPTNAIYCIEYSTKNYRLLFKFPDRCCLAYLHFAEPAIKTINQTDIPEQIFFSGNVGCKSPIGQSRNREREILPVHR